MNDKTLGACQCHEERAPTYWRGVVREYKGALEKAEQERDEARREAREWQRGALNEVQNHRIVRNELDRLRAEPTRPLTADDITAEQQVRARDAVLAILAAGVPRPLFATATAGILARAALRAALTEPTRPEGAEEIEAMIRRHRTSHPGDEWDKLADNLASEGLLPPLTDKTNPEKELDR